jgi:hypothetical protein
MKSAVSIFVISIIAMVLLPSQGVKTIVTESDKASTAVVEAVPELRATKQRSLNVDEGTKKKKVRKLRAKKSSSTKTEVSPTGSPCPVSTCPPAPSPIYTCGSLDPGFSCPPLYCCVSSDWTSSHCIHEDIGLCLD